MLNRLWKKRDFFTKIDFTIFFLALALSAMGLSVIYSFGTDNSVFFKQLTALFVAIGVFFLASNIDIYFLKNSKFISLLYFIVIGLFILLIAIGSTYSGAQSWFSFGAFTFQPTDLAKLVLVLVLAKYFFKRHIEISRPKHLLISGIYALVIFVFLALQPDFGSAMIVFFIWFAFVILVGIPKKYIFALFVAGALLFAALYNFFFKEYQKERILTFLDPSRDPLGAGYNIAQANIALGSGEFWGRGISEGTQSRLAFLPESDTDFIFSSFGEEWGFIGVIILFTIFTLMIARIVMIAIKGRTNFESLLVSGVAIYFATHFFVHVGVNLGLMPVTGTTMPFMSNGGSHLVVEYFALGLVNAVARTNRSIHREHLKSTDIL